MTPVTHVGETNPKEDARCEKLLEKLSPNWRDILRLPGALEFTVGQIYGRRKKSTTPKKMKAAAGA